MKNLSYVLNAILFVLVGVLFYLHFAGSAALGAKGAAPGTDSAANAPLRIAYVNIDSLESQYSYFQEKKAELEKKQESIQNDLSSRARSLQNELAELQKKAPTLTQAQGEAAQQGLMKKQQALQQREQQLRQEYLQQQQDFNVELHRRLDSFLNAYNADKGYSYIFSYSEGISEILYKDSAFDITADVIRGLNAAEKK